MGDFWQRHYNQLREELAKLKPPADLEEEESEDEPIDPQEKQYSTEQGAGPGATAEGAEKEMTSTSAQTATFADPVPPQADFGGHMEFIMLGEDVVDCWRWLSCRNLIYSSSNLGLMVNGENG